MLIRVSHARCQSTVGASPPSSSRVLVALRWGPYQDLVDGSGQLSSAVTLVMGAREWSAGARQAVCLLSGDFGEADAWRGHLLGAASCGAGQNFPPGRPVGSLGETGRHQSQGLQMARVSGKGASPEAGARSVLGSAGGAW